MYPKHSTLLALWLRACFWSKNLLTEGNNCISVCEKWKTQVRGNWIPPKIKKLIDRSMSDDQVSNMISFLKYITAKQKNFVSYLFSQKSCKCVVSAFQSWIRLPFAASTLVSFSFPCSGSIILNTPLRNCWFDIYMLKWCSMLCIAVDCRIDSACFLDLVAEATTGARIRVATWRSKSSDCRGTKASWWRPTKECIAIR